MNKIKSDLQSVEAIVKEFERTSQSYFSLEDFKERLLSGERLNIKYGVDVTAPFLHLGHSVNLWMMRTLQEYGHKVQFLIGDFTTKIGDPTGKSDTRPIIPQNEIEKNAQEFIKQVSLVLKTDDPELFEIRRNSEWFDSMNVSEFLSLLSMVTHSRLVSRDMFQKRIEEQKDIYMHEMLYPILQGYDSFMLKSDLTIVGSDQLFNEMMGKLYQEKLGQRTQIIITTKITPGLDGKNKQSKSLNNYIALADSPRDKFGKAMSMPDTQIIEWMEVYTNLTMDEICHQSDLLKAGKNPRDIKAQLAYSLVEKYHGKKMADIEEEWFRQIFSGKDFPIDCEVIKLEKGKYTIMDILQKQDRNSSRSQQRRLVSQGAVKMNGDKIVDTEELITLLEDTELDFKVGKKTYFRVTTI